MIRFLIFIAIILAAACCKPENGRGELYVANHALDKFDSAIVTITVDDRVVYEDTVTNKYLSFHWDEKSFPIPADSFRVGVNVAGQGFNIKKDTTFYPGESRKQMFITFDFYPYYKRYSNPEIYSHVDTGTFELKKVADSLYKNNILESAEYYLNDTTPRPTNIDIIFKKPEKQIL